MKDYVARTSNELFEIAQGMVEGHIFSSLHLPRPEDALSVFMPLMFLDEETAEIWKDDPPEVLFEYLHKAGPRAINGMPCFMSFQFLDKTDTEKLLSMCQKIEEHNKLFKQSMIGESNEDSNSTASSCNASKHSSS